MLLLFNKIGMAYKSKKVVIEVVKNSYKGSLSQKGIFWVFLITSEIAWNLQW